MAVLIIDNYDSFTFNLFQYLSELGADVVVKKNDEIDLEGIRRLRPSHIILSPGPGTPERPRDFGVCADVIVQLAREVPVLGVCLGHQGIVHHLGGRIVRAPAIFHGKTSVVRHDGSLLYRDLPPELTVLRYHSLIAERASLPDVLVVDAETVEDGLVMGVRHREWPLHGIQFHPESIGTPQGRGILARFLGSSGGWTAGGPSV